MSRKYIENFGVSGCRFALFAHWNLGAGTIFID
jgi:hypothetical protein